MSDEQRQKRNADLIEMLQATHDDIAQMRAFRHNNVPRVPSSAQMGGWTRVVASAIALLKEDAEGWCANSTLPAAHPGHKHAQEDAAQANTLAFSDATINKMQDVMAVHGFAVPVRVISDAFWTTIFAQRLTPIDSEAK